MALRVGARPILLVIALAVSSLVYLSPLGSHVVKHKTFGALGRLRTAEDSGDGSNLGDQEDAMR
jgi:hypothetical protein